MSKKLYTFTHQFITKPDINGYCKFGVSDYILKNMVRFNKISYQMYPKTSYSIQNNFLINLFMKQTFQNYKQQLIINQNRRKQQIQEDDQQNPKIKDILTLSQQMQYDRFVIKKGQPFAILQTYEFDLELTAPVDMRVIQHQYESYYFKTLLTAPYLLQIQCLNDQQLHNLMTEEQYQKSPKFLQTV